MPETGYQEAVQLLIDHLGRQWYGLEADGRDEMERVLRDEAGYDRRRARDMIDAMVRAGTLRYHTSAEGGGAPVVPIGAVMGTSGAITNSGVGPGAARMTMGHWQIGHALDEGPGRVGQVQTS